MKHKNLKTIVFGVAALCLSTPAISAGFQLSEYSVTNLGRAFNGAGVVGDDFSAIAFNPAGMSLRSNGMQAGMTLVMIKADVAGQTVNGGVNPGEEGDISLRSWIPHFFAQGQINDKMNFGLGVYAPYGLSTIYNENWFGRTHALKSYIGVMDVAPALSYQVTKQVTIGGSVFAERADAKLTNDLPSYVDLGVMQLPLGGYNKVEGDDWSYGYTLGVMYEPVKDTRFGLSYRSKVSHHLKGKQTVSGSNMVPTLFGMPMPFQNGSYVGRAKITLPEYVLLSAYHRIDKIGLSASAKWTRWSRFDKLDIYSPNMMNGVSSTPEKWQNVWMLGVGMDYYHDDNWTFRLGVAFDESPVKNAKYRTARIPDNDRWWTSLGVSYAYENVQIDLAYSHMFVKSSKTHNEASGSTLDAKYNMQANLIGLQAQYAF